MGLKVIGDCQKHYDQDIDKFLEALTKNPFESIPILFYYGMKYAQERKGEVFDHNLIEVTEWVEELGLAGDDVDHVTRAFVGALYDNVPGIKEIIDQSDPQVKKNLTGIET